MSIFTQKIKKFQLLILIGTIFLRRDHEPNDLYHPIMMSKALIIAMMLVADPYAALSCSRGSGGAGGAGGQVQLWQFLLEELASSAPGICWEVTYPCIMLYTHACFQPVPVGQLVGTSGGKANNRTIEALNIWYLRKYRTCENACFWMCFMPPQRAFQICQYTRHAPAAKCPKLCDHSQLLLWLVINEDECQ